jgi:hypothetical protein
VYNKQQISREITQNRSILQIFHTKSADFAHFGAATQQRSDTAPLGFRILRVNIGIYLFSNNYIII